MSGEAIGWAFRKVQMDDPTAKFVLVAICNYANENDEAWPSHSSIARLTGLSKRTIQTSIQKLEDWGLITRIRRARDNGSETSAMVSINIEVAWNVAKGIATPATGVSQEPREVWQQMPQGIATDASLETTLKPQLTNSGAQDEYFSEEKPSKPKKKRNTIPAEYPMTDRHKQYAAERGLAVGYAVGIFENFKNHHAAKGSVMLDWDAAWRTWVGNELKFSAGRAPQNPKQAPPRPGMVYGDDYM